MTRPLISVCIVTYNHQAYIADCLMSVLGQWGDFRLEIVVGDDASSDTTTTIVQAIAEQHPGIIRLFRHPTNMGPSQNLHFTITQAQGDFIAHLDGDDFWLPGKLQTQLAFLQTNPDCPACYTNAVVITNDKMPWGFFNQPTIEKININHLVRSGNFLNNSSMLYRETYRSIFFEFPEQLIDYRIHILLSQQGNLGLINQALTAYRLNSATSCQTSQLENFLLLYADTLLSTKNLVEYDTFHQGILNFCSSVAINLIAKQQWDIIKKLISLIKTKHNLTTSALLIKTLPSSLWLDIKKFIHKKTTKYDLRFLQQNSPKKY